MSNFIYGFIVVYDDVPYGWDDDCEGAIQYSSGPIALFPTKAAARKAIKISTAFAKLQTAQGKPCNTDFTTDIRHVKIRKLLAKKEVNGNG